MRSFNRVRPVTFADCLDREVFTFVSCEGYEDRYPTQEAVRLPRERVKELRAASGRLYRIFQKTMQVIQAGDATLLDSLGIALPLRPFLDIKNRLELPTYLSRFDYVLREDGKLKMVELNADTPCAVVEAYYGNQVAADFFREENPNKGCVESLRRFLVQMYQSFQLMAMDLSDGEMSYDRPFVFSCFDDYVEDKATTLFLMNQLKLALKDMYPLIDTEQAVCYCSFYDLQVDEDGVLLPDGRNAGAIYRLHPMELLIEEKAEDETSLGEYFMDRYRAGCFQMFNPPEAIVLQSKALQALIWALHEDRKFFTAEEHEVIGEYMLPSYFDEKDFLANASSSLEYVKKPVWGREGSRISVVKPVSSSLREEKRTEILYEKEITEDDPIQLESGAYLYQEFAETKQVSLRADSGKKEGYLTFSCFLHGKNPSAIYARFSEYEIAGIESYWAPILYED